MPQKFIKVAFSYLEDGTHCFSIYNNKEISKLEIIRLSNDGMIFIKADKTIEIKHYAILIDHFFNGPNNFFKVVLKHFNPIFKVPNNLSICLIHNKEVIIRKKNSASYLILKDYFFPSSIFS